MSALEKRRTTRARARDKIEFESAQRTFSLEKRKRARRTKRVISSSVKGADGKPIATTLEKSGGIFFVESSFLGRWRRSSRASFSPQTCMFGWTSVICVLRSEEEEKKRDSTRALNYKSILFIFILIFYTCSIISVSSSLLRKFSSLLRAADFD